MHDNKQSDNSNTDYSKIHGTKFLAM